MNKKLFFVLTIGIASISLMIKPQAAIASDKPETASHKAPIVSISEDKSDPANKGLFQQITGADTQALLPGNIDPSIIRETMKARAEYDALTRKIIARRQELTESDPTIKKLQVNMRELQRRINEILSEDEELLKLQKKFESISPQMPFGMDKKEPQPLNFRQQNAPDKD